MQPVKQDAIILGGVDYGDTSRVIWVLTPEFGRQNLMVKGARRPKSRFPGSLETFSLVRLIYRKGLRGSMPTLREVDVQRQWEGIRSNLDAFLAASEAVEMIKTVSAEEQESTSLFSLLSDFLVFCDSRGNEGMSLRLALLAFRWRLADLLGVAPQLVECLRCGRNLERRRSYRFLISEGGLLCPDCADSAFDPESSVGFEIGYAGLRFMYRSLRRFPGPDEQLPVLAEENILALERLVGRYLSYHLGEHRAFQTRLSPTGGQTRLRPEKDTGERNEEPAED